jgi:transposase-like protein
MRDSLRIDSPCGWGRAMPKAYSGDLWERVIETVEAGASRREGAERFEVSVASAIKWLQRWREKRSAVPKPRGGSISPLEEFAAEILGSDCGAARPDLGRDVGRRRLRRGSDARQGHPSRKMRGATPSKPLARARSRMPHRCAISPFNPQELQADLSEGKVSRHKEMPQIDFSDEDVYAILSYL